MKLLSTFLDTPAATHGVYAGMTEWKGAELPDDADSNERERHPSREAASGD